MRFLDDLKRETMRQAHEKAEQLRAELGPLTPDQGFAVYMAVTEWVAGGGKLDERRLRWIVGNVRRRNAATEQEQRPSIR